MVRWLLSSKLHTHRAPLRATKSSVLFCCYHMKPLNLGDSNDGKPLQLLLLLKLLLLLLLLLPLLQQLLMLMLLLLLLFIDTHTHRAPLRATKSSALFCCYHMKPLNLGDSNDGKPLQLLLLLKLLLLLLLLLPLLQQLLMLMLLLLLLFIDFQAHYLRWKTSRSWSFLSPSLLPFSGQTPYPEAVVFAERD